MRCAQHPARRRPTLVGFVIAAGAGYYNRLPFYDDPTLAATIASPANATLRVLLVASGDLWAGAEVQIHTLALGLRRTAGVAVHVALLNDGELARRLRDDDVAVSCFPEAHNGMPALLLALWRLTASFRPHVVHTHRQKENVLGGLVALARRIPSLRTAHGLEEHTIAAGDWQRQLAHGLDHLVARLAQRTVASVTDELTARVQAALPFARVVTVDNGIDVQAVRRAAGAPIDEAAFAGADRHVAAIGRLAPVKRFDRAIAIATALARRGEARYRLHLVGDGPEAHSLGQLVEAARADGADIRVHGFVANPLPLLARMQALLFTSEHEGMPMTALEALALGVPVVSRPIGGLCTLHGAGADVHLVASDDPPDFAAAIAELAAPRSAAPLPERFSADHACDAYLALYRECVSATSKRTPHD